MDPRTEIEPDPQEIQPQKPVWLGTLELIAMIVVVLTIIALLVWFFFFAQHPLLRA